VSRIGRRRRRRVQTASSTLSKIPPSRMYRAKAVACPFASFSQCFCTPAL
jgi:hypothetical protein